MPKILNELMNEFKPYLDADLFLGAGGAEGMGDLKIINCIIISGHLRQTAIRRRWATTCHLCCISLRLLAVLPPRG
jgi:hypothetical protein